MFCGNSRKYKGKNMDITRPPLNGYLSELYVFELKEHVLTTGGKQFYQHTVTLSDDGKPYGTCRLPQKWFYNFSSDFNKKGEGSSKIFTIHIYLNFSIGEEVQEKRISKLANVAEFLIKGRGPSITKLSSFHWKYEGRFHSLAQESFALSFAQFILFNSWQNCAKSMWVKLDLTVQISFI